MSASAPQAYLVAVDTAKGRAEAVIVALDERDVRSTVERWEGTLRIVSVDRMGYGAITRAVLDRLDRERMP